MAGTPDSSVRFYPLAGETPKPAIGEARNATGSISALVAKYYRSAEYAGLSDATKATYRGIIERFRKDHGAKPVASLERQHVRSIVSKRAETPSAANNLLRMIRLLMRFAVEEGWRKDDPTLGVKTMRIKSEGFATWSESDIAAFEARHAIGTRARLALALLLYTGQRRQDVVGMGRQHIRDGRIHVTQHKTKVRLAIPIAPELQAVIDQTAITDMTFLTTAHGSPFTPAGFGNWFRDCCNDAGLTGVAAHGLRKAAARRLAEAGCTVHQIAAITGHKTLKEVARYTAAAEQEGLADAAISALSGGKAEQKLANLNERLAKSGSNSLKDRA